MPLRFIIDADAQLVLTTASGEVVPDDLIAHAAALIAKPDRPNRELVDFTEPRELAMSMDDVRKMAEYLRDEDANRPGARLALAGSTDAIFGTLRLFATRRQHDNVEIGVFRDVEEAKRWLLSEEPAPGRR